jgi:hypothetical protein
MKMFKTLSSVSIAALLLVGAPAVAQQPPAPVAASPAAERISHDDLKNKLGDAGIEDREDFEGRLIRAHGPEGHPIFVLIGPENMAGDESVDISGDEVAGRMTQAGFSEVYYVENATLVRGTLDDRDKAILAISGDQGWRGPAGTAQADTPDLERFKDHLSEVGFDDKHELRGVLLRAVTSDGHNVFMIVGPEDFEGDESIELTADRLTEFQSGFDVVEVMQDVKMVRGEVDDDKRFIAISGAALVAEPIATGTTR